MSESFVSLLGILFGVYITVGGVLVITGRRRIGEILWPILVLLLALSLLPGMLSSVVQSAFALVNPWWFIGFCVLLLIGIVLKERASWKS